MKSGTLLKKTRSVCPTCLKEIEAEIYEKNDKIVMIKECNEHGSFEGIVEKSPEFYKKTMNKKRIRNRMVHSFLIPITHRCNLRCKFCYVPNKKRHDLSMEELNKIADSLPMCNVALTGGEPTIREDILDIIMLLKKKSNIRHIRLMTNGIRLSEPGYVKRIHEAGIGGILFSFNGFDRKAYKEINNKDLLETKLRALDNLSKEGILTAISPTIVKGLNEGEISKMIDYILNNSHPFVQLRLRGVAKVGIHEKGIEPFFTSELLSMVAESLGLSMEFFLKGFRPDECYHSPYQFNMRLVFIERGGKRRLLYWDAGQFSRKRIVISMKSLSAFFKIMMKSLLSEGIISLVKSWRTYTGLLGFFNRQWFSIPITKVKGVKSLDINIWAWPDKYNIDLNDIQALNLNHMTHDGKFLNFFEAMVRSHEI